MQGWKNKDWKLNNCLQNTALKKTLEIKNNKRIPWAIVKKKPG